MKIKRSVFDEEQNIIVICMLRRDLSNAPFKELGLNWLSYLEYIGKTDRGLSLRSELLSVLRCKSLR